MPLPVIFFLSAAAASTASVLPTSLRRASGGLRFGGSRFEVAPQQMEAAERIHEDAAKDDDQYDARRPDFDIFNRTLAIEKGHLKQGSGESYPLVTYTSFSNDVFSFEDFPVLLPTTSLEQVHINSCAAGGPVLVGVMSVAGDRHARDRQRRIYRRFGDMSLPPLCATVVYAIGVADLSDEDTSELHKEQAEVGDLALLRIKENMNEGKSYAWFDFAVRHYPSAVYIAKSDVDAFFHPWHLVEQLGRLPNQQLLYGFDCEINNRRSFIGSTKVGKDLIPLPASGGGHMAGSFYTFSRDLLTCSLSTAARNQEGAEDAVSSSWPLLANCSHFFAADMYRFFDHETRRSRYNRWWQHVGWNSKPVLIHFLKVDELWDEVAEWLCQTDGVCGDS